MIEMTMKQQWTCTSHINLAGFYTQFFCSYCGLTVYSKYKSASGLIHLRSLWGSTFVLQYYSLGGDTAMPGGLYAGLYHAFLICYGTSAQIMKVVSGNGRYLPPPQKN